MDWLRENIFWIVIGVLFIWMHTKMHGHGGHGVHGHGGRDHNGGDHNGHRRDGQ